MSITPIGGYPSADNITQRNVAYVIPFSISSGLFTYSFYSISRVGNSIRLLDMIRFG